MMNNGEPCSPLLALPNLVRGGVFLFLYPDLTCYLTNSGMDLESGCFQVNVDHSPSFTVMLRCNRHSFVIYFDYGHIR